MAAPQVAGAAALLLAAYAAGGANVTGRGLEVKALLLATVQRVPGMAHKVRGCIVALTLNLTPRPEGLSSCQRCPGAWQRLRAWRAAAAAPRRASVEPPQSLLLRMVEAWRGWGGSRRTFQGSAAATGLRHRRHPCLWHAGRR